MERFTPTTDKFSRYTQGGRTNIHPTRLGWWERLPLELDATDIDYTITIQTAGRPDKIAHMFYGRANLMWLVLQYNNIVDVVEELHIGRTIRLPDPTRATFDLLKHPIGGVRE